MGYGSPWGHPGHTIVKVESPSSGRVILKVPPWKFRSNTHIYLKIVEVWMKYCSFNICQYLLNKEYDSCSCDSKNIWSRFLKQKDWLITLTKCLLSTKKVPPLLILIKCPSGLQPSTVTITIVWSWATLGSSWVTQGSSWATLGSSWVTLGLALYTHFPSLP